MPNLKIDVLNVVLYSILDAAAMEESKTGKNVLTKFILSTYEKVIRMVTILGIHISIILVMKFLLWRDNSSYCKVASRSNSQLVTPHVTNGI